MQVTLRSIQKEEYQNLRMLNVIKDWYQHIESWPQTWEKARTLGHCPRKFLCIAEISGMTQLILSLSAGESGKYYDITVFLMKMRLWNLKYKDIWLKFSKICGNIKLSNRGNFKYPKLCPRKDSNLSHVWSLEDKWICPLGDFYVNF